MNSMLRPPGMIKLRTSSDLYAINRPIVVNLKKLRAVVGIEPGSFDNYGSQIDRAHAANLQSKRVGHVRAIVVRWHDYRGRRVMGFQDFDEIENSHG